jgi:hypothetical protein
MPDGAILEFPDDTPDSVIDRTAQQHIAQGNVQAAMRQAMGSAVGAFSGSPQRAQSLGAPLGAVGGQVLQRADRVAEQRKPLVPEQYSRGLAQGMGSIVKGGLNNSVGIIANPLGQMLYNATGYGNHTYDMGTIARDALGLPSNQSQIGDAAIGLGSGAMLTGGMAGLAKSGTNPGAMNSALGIMGANPAVDAVSGAGAGAASEYAKQNGAGIWGQIGAGLLGGLGGATVGMRVLGSPTAPPMRLPQPPPNPGSPSAIVQAGREWDVPVYTTDVRPPRTFMGKAARTGGERIPFAGMGGPRGRQQAARAGAVERLAERYGASPGASEDVMRNLAATRGGRLSALAAKRDAGLGTVQGAVQVPNTLAAIDSRIAALRNVGTSDANSVIGRLQDWRQAIQGKDINAINTIRKEMGGAFTDPNLGSIRTHGQEALSSIYGPMRSDIGNAIERAGGIEARSSWQSANDQLSAMAGDLGARNFKGVLRDADVTPEGVDRLLFSRRGSDVNRLYGSLSDTGRKHGQAAIIHRALAEATDNNGAVSPEKFLGAMRKADASIQGFFRGDDKSTIDGFRRLLASTSRAGQSGVETNTGQQMVPLGVTALYGWLARSIGFLPATGIVGGTGAAARVYESAPVRDALIGLSRTRPGTPAEARAITRAMVVGMEHNAPQQLPSFMNSNVGVRAAAGNREEDQRRQYGMTGW